MPDVALELVEDVRRAEVGFLSMLAVAPDMEGAVARLRDVESCDGVMPTFKHADTDAIFHALLISAIFPTDTEDARRAVRAVLVRRALLNIPEWDQTNVKLRIAGMWGPGPVTVLVSRLAWDESKLGAAWRRMENAHRRFDGFRGMNGVNHAG